GPGAETEGTAAAGRVTAAGRTQLRTGRRTMGRMFRIITAASPEPPNGGPATMALDDAEPFVGGGAPFIEVGGPNGPVHSLPKSPPKPAPAAAPEKPPRPSVGEAYLSVALRPVARTPAEPLPHAV